MNEPKNINITEYNTANYSFGTHPGKPGEVLVMTKGLPDIIQAYAYQALEEKARVLDTMGVKRVGEPEQRRYEGEVHSEVMGGKDDGAKRVTPVAASFDRGIVFDLSRADARLKFEAVIGVKLEIVAPNLTPPTEQKVDPRSRA